MAEKVADFEKLLKDLSSRVSEEDAVQIRALLEQVRARTRPNAWISVLILAGCVSRDR